MADTMRAIRGGYDRTLFQSPLYRVWSGMKARCYNRGSADYTRYGGRGIEVCHEWLSFAGFLADMGAIYRPGLTLDRIDNNANYYRKNCRWVDRTVQANNRRSNRIISIGDKSLTLEEWIRLSGIKSSTVRQRFYVLKWPIERALGMEVGYR